MEVLSYEKLKNINGGGNGIWYALGGLFTLVAGIVAGFINPYACKE